MSSEDQFTSIQWDREELGKDQTSNTTAKIDSISEESNSQHNSEGKSNDVGETGIAKTTVTNEQEGIAEAEDYHSSKSNGDDPSASLLISSEQVGSFRARIEQHGQQ